MKKSISYLTLFIASLFVVHSFIAQQPISVISEGAEISFDKSTHDYGQIEKVQMVNVFLYLQIMEINL